jgi:hypothetical protein
MQGKRSHRTVVAIMVPLLACLGFFTGAAEAREVQLAGMRLGQHAVNLLDVYGQPMGIATGYGEAYGTGGATGAVGTAGEGDMGAPDMMGDMGMPAEPTGGPGGFPGEDVGMEPGVAPGTAATATAGVQANQYPLWALPVWVTLEIHEVQWLYRKGGVVIGFVLDRDGYISSIAVAGDEADFARTSLWQPHQYVKLGDSYSRVIYRYGWPDETLTYYSTGPGEVGTGGGPVSVQFGGTVREFSRDSILRYTQTNNVEFTFHNMKCVRVHIWSYE